MPLGRLRISALRCLSAVDCRLDPLENYFFGPNGAGKTSLLEAVYLLGRGRSFRTRHTRRLIQHGHDQLAVSAELAGSAGTIARIGVGVGGGEVSFRLNGASLPGVTQIAEKIRVDVIDPSVHRLIEGGPSERRRYLDWGVFHVEPGYLTAWRQYRRALMQRNAALKAGSRLATEPWDEALVASAMQVDGSRRQYVSRLMPSVSALGFSLLEESISVRYRSGWREGVDFREALREARERDAAAGFTQVGPHRADLSIAFRGRPAMDEASRGQQKLIAAALVIAQVRDRQSGDSVLLVDDPAAELDQTAVGRLLTELGALRCQRIYTGLGPYGGAPITGTVFHVEQGVINECYNAPV